MATTLPSVYLPPTYSGSPRLFNVKQCKLSTSSGCSPFSNIKGIHLTLNKYHVKSSHLIRCWSFPLHFDFIKGTGKRPAKGSKMKNASFQNMAILLGISIVHSGLLFSDMASAAPLFGEDDMAGSIHRIMLGDLDPSTTKLAINILGPLFSAFNILFIVRIVMSWYPQLPVGKFPYVIAYVPTEPFLSPTRKVIPPVGGVDVSPVVWFAIISFLNETLLGQQGLLVLISQQNG